MNNEIGSEFHYIDFENSCGVACLNGLIDDFVMTFSGRTAIGTIIKNTSIDKVMLPSYCCDSMLVPFRDNGIDYCFYNVTYHDGLKIDFSIPNDVDAILWCNYFGFDIDMPDMSDFLNRGGIIIEDITHSFLSEKVYHSQSTYLVASLRKWEPIISGGYCASLSGKLEYTPQNAPNEEYIKLKKTAMELKSRYLADEKSCDKNEFLQMFQKANSWLSDNYSGLCIDSFSKKYLQKIDVVKQRMTRIDNATVLYKGIKNNSNIKPLFDINAMDCPLFVPVIINKDLREIVRRDLIDNKIYCPIHWPHPNAECESNLYEMELSLVCDQRYSENDMNRIISVLDKYK